MRISLRRALPGSPADFMQGVNRAALAGLIALVILALIGNVAFAMLIAQNNAPLTQPRPEQSANVAL